MKREHWTESNSDNFLYRIASDFVSQIEDRMESLNLSQVQVAKRIEKTKGYVSQVLKDPGNLTLKSMILLARALELKISVVAYDDGDHENSYGPINSQIFQVCWEASGRPKNMFELSGTQVTFSQTAVSSVDADFVVSEEALQASSNAVSSINFGSPGMIVFTSPDAPVAFSENRIEGENEFSFSTTRIVHTQIAQEGITIYA